MSTEVIRPYEGIVIVHPDATEEDQKNLFRKNSQIIKDHKGDVNSLETWGSRHLGNPIKKIKKATYFHTTFTANNETVAELERTMRINDKVLRYMHIRLEDGTDLNKYMETFKEQIAASVQRLKEQEQKFQKKTERFAKKS